MKRQLLSILRALQPIAFRLVSSMVALMVVVAESRGAQVELLSNRGFESGPSLFWYRNYDSGIIQGDYPRPGGTWYGWIGNINNAIGSIHQYITIPENASSATLTFYLNIVTYETDAALDDDKLDINFRHETSDALLKKWKTYTEADKGSNVGGQYSLKSISFTSADLSDYKGKTVLLQFYGTTDWGDSTIFRIDDVSFSVTTDDTPTAPSALGTAGYDNRIELAWNDNSGNETGFKIDRKTGSGNWSQLTTVAANSNSYSDYSASQCNTYFYRIRAYNDFGDSGYTDEISNIIRNAPFAPNGLVASGIATGVDLKWTDNACDENGFVLLRKTGANGTWDVIAAFPDYNIVGCVDTSAAMDTTYFYKVYAYNAYGNAYSEEVSAKRVSQYVIGVSAGPNGQVNQSGNITVSKDSDLPLVATPDDNYVVDKWYFDDLPAQVGGNNYTVSMVNAPHTVLVTFKLKTLRLEIGGSIDDTEVFINGTKVSPLSIYNLIYGTQVTVRKNLQNPFQFVDYWSLNNHAGNQQFFGMAMTTPIVSDTILQAIIGTMNSTPNTGGTLSSNGTPVVTVPPSGTPSTEVRRHVQRSHDLVCWHDVDIDPAGSELALEPGPCSFGSFGNETLFSRTLLNVRVYAEPMLMFPIAGLSATSVRVTSLLDHCNADKFKQFRSDGPPDTTWYNGVIGAYNHDRMFMTYKGEILCSGNSTVKILEGLTHFEKATPLSRPLDLNYAYGNEIGYSGHPGYDFGVSGDNVIVVAAEAGKVIPSLSGEYENRIFIEHEHLGLATAYLHLKKWSTDIFNYNDTGENTRLFYHANEQIVAKGQVIGLIGGAGRKVSPILWAGDIRVSGFATKLKAGSNPVSTYLLSAFSTSGRDAVVGYPESGLTSSALEGILITELNAIIRGPSIYDSSRFSGVVLSAKTTELLSATPEERTKGWLNRLLLEDAYGSDLSKTWQYRMDLNRFAPHLHFELYRIVHQDGKKHYVLMDPYGAYSETGKQAYGTSWLPAATDQKTFESEHYKP